MSTGALRLVRTGANGYQGQRLIAWREGGLPLHGNPRLGGALATKYVTGWAVSDARMTVHDARRVLRVAHLAPSMNSRRGQAIVGAALGVVSDG